MAITNERSRMFMSLANLHASAAAGCDLSAGLMEAGCVGEENQDAERVEIVERVRRQALDGQVMYLRLALGLDSVPDWFLGETKANAAPEREVARRPARSGNTDVFAALNAWDHGRITHDELADAYHAAIGEGPQFTP